jgi:hypothetical protein
LGIGLGVAALGEKKGGGLEDFLFAAGFDVVGSRFFGFYSQGNTRGVYASKWMRTDWSVSLILSE